jgi:hypothetical protein
MPFIRRQFAGAAIKAALTGSMTTSSTSVTISPLSGWPDGSVGPFAVTINRGGSTEEKVLCTSRSGASLNFLLGNRGYDGTGAAAHNVGETCEVTITAIDLDEANQLVFSTLGSMTAKGQLVASSNPNAAGVLAAGTTGYVLTADSAQTLGVKWAAATQLDAVGGDITPIVWGQAAAAGTVGKAADAGHIHAVWSRPIAIEHTWAVSGLITVPSGASAFIPPMYASVPSGSSKKLRGVRFAVRGGTSATFSFNQNGVGVTSLTSLTATTGATYVAANTGTPVAVVDGDSFAPVVASISGTPDGLTVSAYFDVIP